MPEGLHPALRRTFDDLLFPSYAITLTIPQNTCAKLTRRSQVIGESTISAESLGPLPTPAGRPKQNQYATEPYPRIASCKLRLGLQYPSFADEYRGSSRHGKLQDNARALWRGADVGGG
ncbi:hypothetical protein EVAR_30523_1 [Eumeta japonica]|uniref:Uncharacterized protein n=1 Tax=Eumeta variegata TaxID=151549 RepID=A0A4C1VZL5_EUMVA|nr:hypothetical protein EVAR_30523_1 [Eumeta japonica]